MIRLFAAAGFVVGFALVLAAPIALLHAMADSRAVTDLPTLTQGDVYLIAGVMGLGLLLAGFSAIMWLASDIRPT
ncbi:uncharacterized protein NP_2164A [Natronomonas pharaonis DSM 2160]|uniref:Uncharacterized protein n=1 Tax=Natronomonas pharaonis (strain ATCC 35678 / DSM 2160 / CIP 103997 / JCM 8858 / NBRC 14720 / NCIMB 2260 / Gabara) TaxID=348780 RepID=A0A1U7EVU1_NATPD|nr:hypothetical protein [Natronomonas pharaonis]CAI49173.1 uncharacterized protein NP_2164A [Natronomonas pharaonis DSM 2160]